MIGYANYFVIIFLNINLMLEMRKKNDYKIKGVYLQNYSYRSG